MNTYAPHSTPDPLGATMHVVIVFITPPKMPVTPDIVPARTIPSSVNPQPVLVTANLPVVVAPEPARTLVIVVATIQMPV